MSKPLDYLDRAAPLDLDIDPAIVERLLSASPLTGNDGRRVIEALGLDELLAMLDREEGRAS
jgi:hypothetical protein